MAKNNMSFMEALLGSFKFSNLKKEKEPKSSKSKVTKDDEFYTEEGSFDSFTEIKEPKKKYKGLKGEKDKNRELF